MPRGKARRSLELIEASKGWGGTFAGRCWELDALSPVSLRARAEAAIVDRLDPKAWARYVDAERVELASIEATVRTWSSLASPDLVR